MLRLQCRLARWPILESKATKTVTLYFWSKQFSGFLWQYGRSRQLKCFKLLKYTGCTLLPVKKEHIQNCLALVHIDSHCYERNLHVSLITDTKYQKWHKTPNPSMLVLFKTSLYNVGSLSLDSDPALKHIWLTVTTYMWTNPVTMTIIILSIHVNYQTITTIIIYSSYCTIN